MHFIICEVNGYMVTKNRTKHLIFASADKNKEVLTKYTKLWHTIATLIETVNDKPGECGNDFRKNKFNSDDSLPWNKMLSLHNSTIIFRSFSRGQQVLSTSYFRWMFVRIIR